MRSGRGERKRGGEQQAFEGGDVNVWCKWNASLKETNLNVGGVCTYLCIEEVCELIKCKVAAEVPQKRLKLLLVVTVLHIAGRKSGRCKDWLVSLLSS